MSTLRIYALLATMYGSARGAFRSSEMDILPGTRFVNVVITGLYSPILFPVYVVNDLNRGYITKHGLKYSDYGYPEKDTSVSDILFR
jgi:hypothetical protein